MIFILKPASVRKKGKFIPGNFGSIPVNVVFWQHGDHAIAGLKGRVLQQRSAYRDIYFAHPGDPSE
jgi:hypothetical protein